ncbi:MAG TPA: response regulator [Longimicrobiales bacterium]|nr:response regulator [Longimicrobiales bacterium]
MPTILIVEDSKECRDIYATALRRKGYDVLLAADGAEGIRVATERRPQLVIMNISMPLVNGVDAVEVLKAHPATEGVPVLVVTGHSTAPVREMAWEAGCDEYLFKPISPAALTEAVERCLQEQGA